jgi:ABC-2 type transport system permease protein
MAICAKEFRQIGRDPLSLGLLVLFPLLLLVLYGYALSFDVKQIRMAVLDLDRTMESRRFTESVFQNSYFEKALVLDRMGQADEALESGVRAVLTIPRGYARKIERGEDAAVQVLVDASDANTGGITAGYIEGIVERASWNARKERLSELGFGRELPLVVPEPRIWFNPELNSSHFLIPGLIGMLMMLSGVIATSLSIVREKERRTMDQLRVSPVRPEELLLGKTMPYVVVCLVTMAAVLLAGRILFGVTIMGSYALLSLATTVFLFAAVGMGLLVSAATSSQQIAFQLAIITSLLPSVILSGLIFPIKNMPIVIRAISAVVVPRHFIAALRGIILKDAGFAMIWPHLVAMLVLGLVFNLAAASILKREGAR